jgi:hypothetical protein
VFTSRRNQPPICAPVAPSGRPWTLNLRYSSFIRSIPPPSYIQAFCWRVLRPKGRPVPMAKASFLPV